MMKKLLLLNFLLATVISYSQATLVQDINLGNNSSAPGAKTVFKNEVYFPANDGVNGIELWKTNGTEAGTVLVKDIYVGSDTGLKLYKAIATSDFLYFFAIENSKQYLWKTDGTEAGTEKVKEFSSVGSMYDEINGKIIFSAENSLWASDGSEAGTIKIANYAVFGDDRFVKNGNEIYFSAEATSSVGKELYKTDGTQVGTKLVKDIRSGSSDSFPNQFAVINNVVFFSASNGTSGTELWTTDGSEIGTKMVKDINSGSGNTFTYNSAVRVFNNELYFIYDNSLWKSDGSETGTVIVKTDLGSVKTLIIVDNKILIIAYNFSTQKQVIWVSDGTNEGTTSFNPNYTEFSHNNEYGIVGNELFFQANNDCGYELWKTDGTESGTFLVKDIHPEFDDNNIEDIVGLNGKAIFTASDGNWLGKELYISDGTENGTNLLKDINKEGNRSSSPQNYFQFGDKLLFSADNGVNGRELWVLENGSPTLLKDINVGPRYSNPSNFKLFNGIVYFSASTKEKGRELWKTDGTEVGTEMVLDINLDAKDGLANSNFVTLNNKLYFFGNDGTTGMELWESDGTATGTKLVVNINGTDANSIYITDELVLLNNELFFVADNAINGAELYKSDGTASGTVLVKDINTNGSGNVRYLNVHPYLNKLYFSAYDGSGSYLYESDGTGANTFKQSVKSPSNFTFSGSRDIGDRNNPNIIYNTELYFSGEATSNFNKKGTELWAVTYSGTIQQVFDVNPDTGSSYPAYLTDHKGKLYFVAYTNDKGYELWKANGVSDAELVKDIQPGTSNANINEMVSFGDELIFGAGNNSQNKELWTSDGTETGTTLLQDINPSTAQYGNGSNPSNFFVSENILYFSANNGTTGGELWMLQENALSVEEDTLNQFAEISVYPNPTSTFLNLKVDNQQIKFVRLINLMGKEVINTSAKENINKIDVSNLPMGMYLLQVKTNTSSFTKKIIKK